MPNCIYCKEECKSGFDSRPYPNSKSKDRIHNKCKIKKTLDDKKKPPDTEKDDVASSIDLPESVTISTKKSEADKFGDERMNLIRIENERKLAKMIEEKSKESERISKGGQFFFDLKAGIAKPHEKRRYLHHRNLCEIAARYDDQGFQDEAVGRAYDHTGKDLNTLGDASDEDDQELGDIETRPRDPNVQFKEQNLSKRKYDHKEDQQKEKRKREPKVTIDEERNPCWFCLSSPKVEKHLIVAIGDYCYLTLAKGGLTDDHLLLIPIEHLQSLNDNNPKELLEELERFKKSLVEYFGRKSKGVVFFERNFRSIHWQLQVVPIPLDVIDTIEENIKSTSNHLFKNSNYLDIPENCSLCDIIPPGVAYFYWQLEPIRTRFVTQIQVKGAYFPIQLGRLVLADTSILNCPNKIDWKVCTKSQDEYVTLVQKIKETYGEFDITSC